MSNNLCVYSWFSNKSVIKSIEVGFDQTRLDDIFTLFSFVKEGEKLMPKCCQNDDKNDEFIHKNNVNAINCRFLCHPHERGLKLMSKSTSKIMSNIPLIVHMISDKNYVKIILTIHSGIFNMTLKSYLGGLLFSLI